MTYRRFRLEAQAKAHLLAAKAQGKHGYVLRLSGTEFEVRLWK